MKNGREEKLYIQTFHEIRGYIIQNQLKAGDPLPTEQAMCQRLGVSRNVLREAIKSMELMGMIKACPGRGTVVKDFNLGFIFQNVLFFTVRGDHSALKEMLDIRKTLELGYMKQAYDALSDADIEHVRQCLETIKDKWSEHIFFHADDMAFHMAIFSPLGNSVLNSMMDAIWGADANFCTDEKMKYLADTVQKHERIVEALEARDYPAFERAMQAHFASGKYSDKDTFEEF